MNPSPSALRALTAHPLASPQALPQTFTLMPGAWQWRDASWAQSLISKMSEARHDRGLRSQPRWPGDMQDPSSTGLFDPATIRPVAARVVALPFYDGAHLVHLDIAARPDLLVAMTLFCAQDQVQVIDGCSPWIHAWNAGVGRAPGAALCLRDAADAASYLKFFCGAVWGTEGPFRVIEDLADPLLEQAHPVPQHVAERLRPVCCERKSTVPAHRPVFEADATVLYAGCLFGAEFQIHDNGIVEMVEDEPLLANIASPWRIDGPVHQRIHLGSLS